MIADFTQMDTPDSALVDKILKALCIPGFLELGFALNKPHKRERMAAISIVERYIPGLLSDNENERLEAQKELDAFFEDVPMLNEDA